MKSGTSFFQNPQHVFLYLLTYILLAEWLFPLPYFTDTGYVHVFLLLTAFLFVINAISMHFILRLLLVTAAILYSMHTIFFQDVFLGISWWQTFLSMTFEQTLLIFTGDLYALNEMYRSFLFMILLALMSFLTFYWVVYVRRMMFFFICSVVYVAVLDTFTLYDGSWAMLRLFIIGFVLVAHLKMSRLSLTYTNISMRHWWRWSIVTLVVVSIATTAAVSAPKLTPQWPNPVPFIQAAGGFGTEYDTGNRRIGYGDHDDRLGGGFEMDDTPVMYASVDNPGYWRGESKHVYTGHGWVTEQHSEAIEERGNVQLYGNDTEVEEQSAHVTYTPMFSANDMIFTQGEFLEARSNDNLMNYYVDSVSGRIEMGSGYNEEAGMEIEYNDADFSIERMEYTPLDDSDDPESIVSRYLQLPNELPDRVRELADDLTSESENRYDAVKAIETHLRLEYDYEIENVPIPEEGQDYVDQFLFDSQIGYCDNFSTAMVVMLRSQDIPSRWVKGFTSGELSDTEDNQSVYEVSNSNAHSWVEVYFPDVGWVPFEPTPGFDNESSHVYTDIEIGDTEDVDPMDDYDPLLDEQQENAGLEEEEEGAAAVSGDSSFPTGLVVVLIGGVVTIAATLFFLRKKLIYAWMKRKHRSVQSKVDFLQAYESVLWYLKFIGLTRAKHETLSEYASRIDFRFQDEQMSVLTNVYHDLYYGAKDPVLPEKTDGHIQKLFDYIHKSSSSLR